MTKEERLKEKWSNQRAKRGYSDCDAWNINSWFLEVMPKALSQMRKNLHGSPVFNTAPIVNSIKKINEDNTEENFKKWQDILDRMIFLLQEMNEDTCSYKNRYEKDLDKINTKFTKKYGFAGEKLRTKEEKVKKESIKMYTPADVPEEFPTYKDVLNDWIIQEHNITYYRNQCKEEFFNLFSQYFWDLWD